MANFDHVVSTYDQHTRVSPNRSGIRLTESGGLSAHERLVQEKIAAGDPTGMTSADRRRAIGEWRVEVDSLEESLADDWSIDVVEKLTAVRSAISRAAEMDRETSARNHGIDPTPIL